MLWTKLLLVCAAALLVGCNPPHVAESRKAGADTNREVYQVKGTVKELKPDGKTAVIDHDEIPGYMDRMIMDFEVKDKGELAGLKPNDRIAFALIVTTNDAWIENVHKIAPESVAQLQQGTNNTGPVKFRKAPVVEPLEVGNQVPDWKFTNHLGQAIGLAQYRGKALGITFIFTRCPLPTYCPRMSGNFSSVAQILATNQTASSNWMLLSLSFDPEFDTPARLAAYAKGYNPNTNYWQFATGDFWNIDGFTEQLGLTFWKADGTINHNLRTIVIDARGRLQKSFVGNEWKPEEFAEEMVKAAAIQ